MNDTILMLYQDLFAFADNYMADIPEHRSARQKASARHDAFWTRLATIDPMLAVEMDRILEEQLKCDLLELPEAFCGGFRLGAKLMLDILSDS